MRHPHRSSVVAVAAALLLTACSSASPPASAPAPSPTSTRAALRLVEELDPVTISATPFPDWVTVTEQGVWVANVGPGLTRYDRTGAVTAEVATGSIDNAMEAGFGRLWATSAADPETGSATVVGVDLEDPSDIVRVALPGMALPSESSVAVDDDAVWVLAEEEAPVLVQIDPLTAEIRGTMPAPDGAAAVRGGYDSLWVGIPGSDTVLRIDPADGSVQAELPTGPAPTFIALGAGAVWVVNSGDGSVTRIDPETDEAETVPASSAAVSGGDIAASDSSVWVRSTNELAVRLDPTTLQVTARLGRAKGSGSIGIDGDGVWISAHDVEAVYYVASPQ